MKKIEKEIWKYLDERGWSDLRPSDIAKSISIESAELLEIFQWKNLTAKQAKNNPKQFQRIKEELADVFIYALDMAVILGLDTEEIILQKLDMVKKKYPAKKKEKTK